VSAAVTTAVDGPHPLSTPTGAWTRRQTRVDVGGSSVSRSAEPGIKHEQTGHQPSDEDGVLRGEADVVQQVGAAQKIA
jgi:hypothetical protein